MQCKRSWTIAIAVLILLAVATKYVSAKVESQTATQPVGEDVQDIFTFRVRIQNVSPESDVPTLFAPGVWVLHSEAGPLFTSGEADRDQGLEALAEDGNPTALAASFARAGSASRSIRYTGLRRHAGLAAKRRNSRIWRFLRVRSNGLSRDTLSFLRHHACAVQRPVPCARRTRNRPVR